MTISEYQSLIKKARGEHLKISKAAIDKLQLAMERAYEDVVTILHGIDNDPRLTAQRQFWKFKKTELQRLVEGLKNGYSEALREGMTLTSVNASEISKIAEGALLSDTGLPVLAAEFNAISVSAVDAIWRRIGSDGLTLSKRIWKISEHVRRRTDAIVLSGIARGQSAVNMAKTLQFDILGIGKPEDIPVNLRWTTGVSKSVSGRGTIHYNALRLARTEIGNTYHEADIMAAKASRVVGGMRWNLSVNHGAHDICDLLASQDVYGLGPGIYPPEVVPLYPHPNDMCFVAREIRPPSKWGKPRPIPDAKTKFSFSHPKETTFLDATRKKEITRKVTANYRKTVEAQFKAMIENTAGTKRIKRAA